MGATHVLKSVSLSAFFLIAAALWGATPVDIAKLGPQVGQPVPDFRLKDQNGQYRNLRSVMGPKGVMLVFFRSADW